MPHGQLAPSRKAWRDIGGRRSRLHTRSNRSMAGEYVGGRLDDDGLGAFELEEAEVTPERRRFDRKPCRPALSRVLRRIEVGHESGCWLWAGTLNRGGYGSFKIDGKTHAMHRLLYEEFRGPIPAGLELDHLCRVRHCVNPQHLEPVTRRENCLRGTSFAAINAAKEACKHGHPYSGDNLYVDGEGRRFCRECRRVWARTSYLRRRDGHN
jgi:hypothetical protein